MNDLYSLERLIDPVPADLFLREHWERKPLRIHRSDRGYLDGLLTLDDVDRVLTTLALQHPEIAMTDASRSLSPQDYTFTSGMIDVARLYREFSRGATIILTQLHLRQHSLGMLCRSMEHALSTRFQTNVYVTPPNAQGFKPHYDSHDVFVLQVHGSKRWMLYESPVELPYRGQDFDPSVHHKGEVIETFDLEAGDVLYVPRGWMHDARATDSVSVHVTLGVLFTSWTELLLEALGKVGLTDTDFRRALPPGFSQPGFDRTAARATFRSLLERFTESADFDAALDHFADDLITSRHPLIRGQLHDVVDVEKLDADTRLGAVPCVLHRLDETDEHVSLVAYGGALRFPRAVTDALRFALTAPSYTARDLPGPLDEPGRLTLLRRLVVEGFVRRV